ncbi:MAG: heparinase, partial [bacterium]|nr:heparinase [bacterium]
FSHKEYAIGSPPDWFFNPFSETRLSDSALHWSRIGDFKTGSGDIKGIWELSRFEWTLLLARAFRSSGDPKYLNLLNEWISAWTGANPLNIGPNWKCGQETAIRMMHMLLAAYLLKQHRTPSEGLHRFVTEHCSRIAPTLWYAMAQDNNHGTSEAAALYIGGTWLLSSFPDEPGIRKKASKWHRTGRRWLENRVRKLIATDGSFSQYSLNYHRVLLDTLNLVEFWRREWQLPKFSDLFYERSRAAVLWLHQTIEPETGDGPNLGANDGARLFVLSETEYRDYRPSVQLASVLFFEKKIYPAGKWDEPLTWLGLNEKPTPPLRLSRKSGIMPDGGYVLMHFPSSWAVIRFPNFRFRPGHADALHFDLWYKGLNIFRDSGSYSYNTEEPWQSYFSRTQAHNTVEFDGRDQMLRIGRFLFGSWLKVEQVGELIADDSPFEGGGGMSLSWTGSYTDHKGCRHQRTVHSNGVTWRIIDDIRGFTTKAVLRWRLIPGTWQLNETRCVGDSAELSVDASVPIVRCELVEGWESRYYMEKTALPVLEIEVAPGRAILTTDIHLKG